MKIEQVKCFEDFERYLREFTNFPGDPVPYDFNGAFRLFLAILENLSRNHLDADIESHEECRRWFNNDQQQFLNKLNRHV